MERYVEEKGEGDITEHASQRMSGPPITWMPRFLLTAILLMLMTSVGVCAFPPDSHTENIATVGQELIQEQGNCEILGDRCTPKYGSHCHKF